MKTAPILITLSVVWTVLLTACASQPSTLAIQTAIAQTRAAEPTVTATRPAPPTMTATIPPTATPRPVPTMAPTATSVPSPTPVPEVERNETKKIGPILDSSRSEQYTLEVTLKRIRFSNGDWLTKPKPGRVFVAVDLRFKNLGPGAVRSVSDMDLQVLDANGALQGTAYTSFGRECDFRLSDLTAGGSVEGCAEFEIPTTGRVELVYAPFRYEGLKEGRYLKFILRDK